MYKTETGRRPDLEGLEVNPGIGYIGNKLYPVVSSNEKTGDNYYRTRIADSAAQTGRTPGDAPTITLLSDSHAAFTCAEVIKRYGMVEAEVKQAGGIAQADKQGGEGCKRSVARAIEDAQIAQLLDGAHTDISATIIEGIGDGASAVRRFAGKTAFVCSESVYRWIIKSTQITGKLGYTFPTHRIDEATTLSVKTELFRAMLQSIIGIDEILIFDDDSELAGAGDAAAIVKLPPMDALSHKLDPVLGKTNLYLPDGEQGFEINSFFNEDTMVNTYTAKSWYVLSEFNVDAKYLVDGLDTAS